MFEWNFFMRECIYWMHEIFFECVYDVCLKEFVLWENSCMIFFFWEYFFEYRCMHKKNSFFENAYMNEIFRNAYTMYEILEKCIRDFVNEYIDVHNLILFLWKYMHENLFLICFRIFHFFYFMNGNVWMDAPNCIFFNDMHDECSTFYFFYLIFFCHILNDNLCLNALFF